MKKEKKSDSAVHYGSGQKKNSKSRRLTMNSEVRSLEISDENMLAAIEQFLNTMRLLKSDESVVAIDRTSSDKSVIQIKKEVLN